MLFITNRVLNEGPTPINPDDSYGTPRSISFDLSDNQAEQSIYFCRRNGPNDYTEIGSRAFFDELRNSAIDQILIYIHGFSSLPENPIFGRVAELQALSDRKAANQVMVIPLIWPCDNKFGMVRDYFDDQLAADASAFAFARLFEKFLEWREEGSTLEKPCTKWINVLAHSMGNRVLRGALSAAVRYYRPTGIPLIFRNIFMSAADVVNSTLEPGEAGEHIPESARNLVVYYAGDDLAMRASKVANMRVTTRRLGHTGPSDMSKVAQNVYSVDCGDFNNEYDRPAGHGYFASAPDGSSGLMFDHVWECIRRGRVPLEVPQKRTQILSYRFWD